MHRADTLKYSEEAEFLNNIVESITLVEEILLHSVHYLWRRGLADQIEIILEESEILDLNHFFPTSTSPSDERDVLMRFLREFADRINADGCNSAISPREFYMNMWKFLAEKQRRFHGFQSLVLVALTFVHLPGMLERESWYDKHPMRFLQELSYWFLHTYRGFSWAPFSQLFFDPHAEKAQIIKGLERNMRPDGTSSWKLVLLI